MAGMLFLCFISRNLLLALKLVLLISSPLLFVFSDSLGKNVHHAANRDDRVNQEDHQVFGDCDDNCEGRGKYRRVNDAVTNNETKNQTEN